MAKTTKTTTLPAPAGEHVTDITFPLSVEYVKGWTSERAVAEIISNAIDADANFTVKYENGILEVLDDAEGGVGAAGMILGYSTKTGRGDLIGQFGEGLKIGLLVLLRDKGVTGIHVDTAGYAFTPGLVEHHVLAGLGLDLDLDGPAPQVMNWRIHKSTRSRGTRVLIACTPKLAQAAMDRFLYLSRDDYTPPKRAQVLFDVPKGSVYIGGVLVSDKRKLAYSYDLPLAVAKEWQNRDRTVLDNWQLGNAIADALAAVEDPQAVRSILEGILEGKLTDGELRWLSGYHVTQMSAATRATWAQEGKRRWPEGKVFYHPPSWDAKDYTESILDLQDRGYVEFTARTLAAAQVEVLAQLLGVRKPKAAAAERSKNKTTWAKNLTETQQQVLDQGVAAVRAAFGDFALDRVRVFTASGVSSHEVPDLEWNGYYEPGSGMVAVHVNLLDSLDNLLPTLLHESAHRLAHRYPTSLGLPRYTDHTDRSRGFEATLHSMGGRLLLTLAQGRTLDSMHVEEATAPTLPGLTWSGSTGRNQSCVLDTAAEAAALFNLKLEEWAAANEVPARSRVREYAQRNYVNQTLVAAISRGRVTSVVPLARFLDICKPLDLDGYAMWWAMVGPQGRYEYVNSKWQAGRKKTRFREAANTIEVMREAKVHLDLIDDLAGICVPGAALPEDDSWLDPVRKLFKRTQELAQAA